LGSGSFEHVVSFLNAIDHAASGVRLACYSTPMAAQPSLRFSTASGSRNAPRQGTAAKSAPVDLPALQNASRVLLDQVAKDAQIVSDLGETLTACMLSFSREFSCSVLVSNGTSLLLVFYFPRRCSSPVPEEKVCRNPRRSISILRK